MKIAFIYKRCKSEYHLTSQQFCLVELAILLYADGSSASIFIPRSAFSLSPQNISWSLVWNRIVFSMNYCFHFPPFHPRDQPTPQALSTTYDPVGEFILSTNWQLISCVEWKINFCSFFLRGSHYWFVLSLLSTIILLMYNFNLSYPCLFSPSSWCHQPIMLSVLR